VAGVLCEETKETIFGIALNVLSTSFYTNPLNLFYYKLKRLEEFFKEKYSVIVNRIFLKKQPNRSAWISDCAFHMALDGALHAWLFGQYEYRNYRLEESQKQAVDFVHDDNEIL
jgi:hypothetical protein